MGQAHFDHLHAEAAETRHKKESLSVTSTEREVAECTFKPVTNTNYAPPRVLHKPTGYEQAVGRLLRKVSEETKEREAKELEAARKREEMRLKRVPPKPFSFQTERRASVERKQPLLYMDVNLGPGRTGRIGLHEGDNITALCSFTGDPHMPVTVPANHPLTLGTSFLDWVAAVGAGPGGVALVLLSTCQMLAAFGSKLSCSRSPADLPAADQVNPLTLGLSGAAWTRILNEYLASGLLGVSLASRAELTARLNAITIVNPHHLRITSADWQLGEDVTGAPGLPGVAAAPAIAPTPAVGRRGQRGYRPAVPGAPAIPAVLAAPGRAHLDPVLRFLTLAHIFELECEGPSPWGALAYLAGALGPVLTQAERNRPGSQEGTGTPLGELCVGARVAFPKT